MLAGIGLYAGYHGLAPAGLLTPKPTPLSSRPYFYLSNLETRIFDEEGALSHILQTPRASQQAEAGKILLEEPRLKATGSDGNEWNVSAHSGITTTGLEQIRLENQVRITNQQGPTEVFLEELEFDGAQEIAYSSGPIRIVARESETRATGVHIDFRNETFALKKNVITRYHPEYRRIKPADPVR